MTALPDADDVERLSCGIDQMSIYDWGGSFYDAFHLSVTLGREERLKRDAIASLELQPMQRVLDWGCGTGLSLKWLARELRHGGTIYAVEASPAMAKRAVSRAQPTTELEYHFILRTGLQLELPEPVDAAVASYSLGVLSPSEFETAVRGIWDNLKPGGRLLVLDMYVPQRRRWIPRLYQWLTIIFAGWLFRQDFSEMLLPVVERYFRPLQVRHDPSQMAVTFLGERRPKPDREDDQSPQVNASPTAVSAPSDRVSSNRSPE